VRTGNQEGDCSSLVSVADVHVAQSAGVADGHSTAAVELVTTTSVLDRWGEQGRAGFDYPAGRLIGHTGAGAPSSSTTTRPATGAFNEIVNVSQTPWPARASRLQSEGSSGVSTVATAIAVSDSTTAAL
jgi:hypothetical protein